MKLLFLDKFINKVCIINFYKNNFLLIYCIINKFYFVAKIISNNGGNRRHKT